MKLKWIIPGIILLLCNTIDAQPLIGMEKVEVQNVIKKERKEFRVDKTIVKQQFNYLKYVNNFNTLTLIVFFSDEDICTKTKLICDYSEYDFILSDLNKTCRIQSDSTWEYDHEGSTYLVTLEKQEWYFIIREVLKEQKKKKGRSYLNIAWWKRKSY